MPTSRPAPPDKPVEAVESTAGLAPDPCDADRDDPALEDQEALTSWIEIQLVDEAGEPVSGERCRVKLANGRTVRSVTNAEGMIRLESIAEGICEVTFERLDAEAWQPA